MSLDIVDTADLGEQFLQRLTNAVKDALLGTPRTRGSDPEMEKKDMGELTLFKGDDGQYRWLATYSNSFIDKDEEIITANSHRQFVKEVEDGDALLPQLWIHHEPGWRFGKASFVGVDEIDANTVMAVAGGLIDKDKSWLAEKMINSETNFRMSHGMPIHSLRRNPANRNLIESHETVEITVLIAGKESNDLTGFILTKENDMIDPNKREAYAAALGMDESDLVRLEEANGAVASKASASGRLHKDSEMEAKAEETQVDEVKEEVEEVEATQEEAKTKEDKVVDVSPEIEALKAQMTELKEAVLETFGKLGAQLKADREAIEDFQKAVAEKASMTPEASLAEQFASAIGSPETQVDGRTKEAKQAPEEAAAPVPNSTGIGFLDQLRVNSVANAGRSAAALNSMGQMAHIQGLNSQGEN